jgi:uncharacterized membrane protein YfcA
MKSLKLGNLVFNKKAILLLAFCLFINGIVIGALVASHQSNSQKTNVLVLMMFLLSPYLLLHKSIRKNIKEIN